MLCKQSYPMGRTVRFFKMPIKVVLGISRTNADSQWNLFYWVVLYGFSKCRLRWCWVFLARTRILSGIYFTTHFIEFFVVETKRFVGCFVNVILTRLLYNHYNTTHPMIYTANWPCPCTHAQWACGWPVRMLFASDRILCAATFICDHVMFEIFRASCRRKKYWIPPKTCNSGRLHNHGHI